MISVVIPTRNSSGTLPDTLAALVPAAINGLVREVIVADGGSSDATLLIANEMGARIASAECQRGAQLVAGAGLAKGDWLMFLPSDAVLEPGWEREAETFILRATRSGSRTAAAFRFALDDPAPAARRTELWVGLRCRLLGLPYSDQGLIINRRFYDELGGYKPMVAMEDVDLMRRIGRARIAILKAAAMTSAERFRKSSSLGRAARDIAALAGYYMRVPARLLTRLCA
jgi:glycosyltransferase involved in cell wall biosynthesis